MAAGRTIQPVGPRFETYALHYV